MVEATDVLRGFRFRVSIQNLPGGDTETPHNDMGFMRVSGLQADVGVYEWQEVTDPVTVHKLPDRIKFSDLVLERGVAFRRTSLWQWFTQVEDALRLTFQSGTQPRGFRSDLTITVFDKGVYPGRGSLQWHVFSAFPKSIKFGDFDAQSSSVVIESLTLAHEGYRRVSVPDLSGDLNTGAFGTFA